MTSLVAAGVALLWTVPVRAEIPESVRAGLRSASAEVRAAAIMEVAVVKQPDDSVLELVADALLDPVEDVRVTAAYAIPRLVGQLGCELHNLAECEPLLRFVEPPVKVKTVAPVYPDLAKRSGLEGSVLIQCLVRESGVVEQVATMSGPDGLRDPALAAFKRWTYRPALRKGKPVPLAMSVRITFRLR